LIMLNPLSAGCGAYESETTSRWNWKGAAKPEGEAHAGIKSLSFWT